LRALARPDFFSGIRARRDYVHDAQGSVRVVALQRVAVHHRAVEGRGVRVRRDVLGERHVERLLERHAHGGRNLY
jgi:hypothetical protein